MALKRKPKKATLLIVAIALSIVTWLIESFWFRRRSTLWVPPAAASAILVLTAYDEKFWMVKPFLIKHTIDTASPNEASNDCKCKMQQSMYRGTLMRNVNLSTDQLIWGAVFVGWLLGISTMLLLGYTPDNCFISNWDDSVINSIDESSQNLITNQMSISSGASMKSLLQAGLTSQLSDH